MKKMTNVLILEDLYSAQCWLKDAVLMAIPEANIVCVDRVRKALGWLELHTPDLCLVDLSLPDGSGVSCIARAKVLHAQAPVLVITMFDDDQHLLPAIQAGADGYLLKEEPKASIAQAIESLMSQQPALSAQVTQRLMQIVQEIAGSTTLDPCPLTPREQEVLRSVAEGYQTSAIAEFHNISPHTAAKHIKNIYAKLGINSRTQAVHAAIRFGLKLQEIPNTGDSIDLPIK